MLELLGIGYAIDHCIAVFNERQQMKLYQNYITDALKAAYHLDARYADLIKPRDPRTATQIITHFRDEFEKMGETDEQSIT